MNPTRLNHVCVQKNHGIKELDPSDPNVWPDSAYQLTYVTHREQTLSFG